MFKAIFYTPLYNALVGITDIIPGHYLAVSIIILTLIVKIILYPLSKKAVITQLKMKIIEPEAKALREKYNKKEDRQILAQKTLELYRSQKMNPFSMLLLALIQIPIFISLAFIFSKNTLAPVDMTLLYSFVSAPDFINQQFFFANMGEKSIILGALAGILQFFQIRLSVPAYQPSGDGKPSMKDDFARSMNVQMRYVMPVIVFFVSLGFTAALSLYWIVSTIFTIGQELYFRKTVKKEAK